MSRSPFAYTSTGVSGTACRTETVAVSAAVAGVATRTSAPATPTAPAARLNVRIEFTGGGVLPWAGMAVTPSSSHLWTPDAVERRTSARGWGGDQRPGPG